MNCPKCDTANADDSQDCVACGVVFERWRAAQERALLQRTTAARPAPAPAHGIPAWMVIAGAVVIVLLGTMWTVRSRGAREKNAGSDDILNEINNKVVRAQVAAAGRSRVGGTGTGKSPEMNFPPVGANGWTQPLRWPEGLDEAQAKSMIQRCRAFSISHDVAMPKVFPRARKSEVLQRFQWLQRAVRQGYVQLDEVTHSEIGYVEAKIVPSAWSKVPFNDTGTHFELRMGRPRIKSFTGITTIQSGVRVGYAWEYDAGKASDLIFDRGGYVGRATFTRIGTVWSLDKAWIGGGSMETNACD